MGGDFAPANVVAGVVEAVRMHGHQLVAILVGDEAEIRAELERNEAGDLGIEIMHAGQRVEMDEKAADSFRKKKDSSLAVATRAVRDGLAEGVFSAGNTGAMVAASLLNIGRLPGVSRPALATPIPTQGEVPWAVVLDVGATSDCKAINLLQFAIMGEVYARHVLGKSRPRVGLLNIGEEPGKGSDLVQEAYPLLKASGLNFVGNLEGKDILHGHADVVVTDGFTGNVLLKFSESVVDWVFQAVRREIGEHLLAKMGGYLLKPSLKRFKARVDYTEIGGAPLLGVQGLAIIGHGRSNPKAIRNALRTTAELINQGVREEIRGELERVNGGKVVNS
jgi:glycerol-3-phosphate acyltransferase PlsX